MVSQISFTAPNLKALPSPTTGHVYYRDKKYPQLLLDVTAGRKTFYMARRVHGRATRLRLGRFPGMSIDEARQRLNAVNTEVDKGADPVAERRKLRTRPSLGDLFQHYMAKHAKLRKRSWKGDEDQYRRYLSGWTDRKLDAISRGDVQILHGQIGADHGQYAANRLIALLRKMFNMAADIGFEGANPVVGITKFREESRERFLSPDEMPRFLQALEDEPDATIRDFLKLALFTGARRGNVQGMKWAHVDLTAGVWTIPASAAKGGYALSVVLAPPALEVLRRRRAEADGQSEFVLPGWGKSGHLEEPKAAWKALLLRAGIARLRIHDLRRTLGSWQAAAGISLPIIGKTLGHRNASTTQIYARLDLSPVMAAVTKATDAMLAAGHATPEPAKGATDGADNTPPEAKASA